MPSASTLIAQHALEFVRKLYAASNITRAGLFCDGQQWTTCDRLRLICSSHQIALLHASSIDVFLLCVRRHVSYTALHHIDCIETDIAIVT